MTVTRDQELWVLALHVEQQHGSGGPRHIAEMIGKAALAGDEVAVGLWKAAAVKFDQLRDADQKV